MSCPYFSLPMFRCKDDRRAKRDDKKHQSFSTSHPHVIHPACVAHPHPHFHVTRVITNAYKCELVIDKLAMHSPTAEHVPCPLLPANPSCTTHEQYTPSVTLSSFRLITHRLTFVFHAPLQFHDDEGSSELIQVRLGIDRGKLKSYASNYRRRDD